ncbi:MAG: hypothetical protein ACLQUW_00255 [Desulfobaccales bacterium]
MWASQNAAGRLSTQDDPFKGTVISPAPLLVEMMASPDYQVLTF